VFVVQDFDVPPDEEIDEITKPPELAKSELANAFVAGTYTFSSFPYIESCS
jgi:hypothetical protein